MINLVPGAPRFVEQLLADRIGLDVASVGEGLIVRGTQTRMKHLGLRRLEDYQRILLSTSDEVQALVEEVVIPESWFFRDDRPFATFREFAQVGWAAQPSRRPLSVLCLPCASGEEPYSVAIALLELGLPAERFEVVAIDISERSIQRAAAALYSRNAFRGMDPRLQAQYFTALDGRFLLKAAVRAAVRFVRGNILDPTLLGQRAGFDVVFCRNLLIYFDDLARGRAFANLDRLTAPEGLLFLGHADRPDPDLATRFVAFADRGSFVYQKRTSRATPSASPPPPRTTQPPAPPQAASRPLVPMPARRVPVQAAAPPVAAPGPVGAEPAPVGATDAAAVLTQASILADQGRYHEATKLLRAHLGRGTLDAGAHFLLGIIHQAAGDRVAAEAELTKAVYLNPEHDEALLALALLARRKGDMAAEALYRRRADRVLARKERR